MSLPSDSGSDIEEEDLDGKIAELEKRREKLAKDREEAEKDLQEQERKKEKKTKVSQVTGRSGWIKPVYLRKPKANSGYQVGD